MPQGDVEQMIEFIAEAVRQPVPGPPDLDGVTTHHIETDCRSDDGITVGIVDSIITLRHLLSHRNIKSNAVREALRDLDSLGPITSPEPELPKCPYCGGEMKCDTGDVKVLVGGIAAVCHICRSRGPARDTEAEAIAAARKASE